MYKPIQPQVCQQREQHKLNQEHGQCGNKPRRRHQKREEVSKKDDRNYICWAANMPKRRFELPQPGHLGLCVSDVFEPVPVIFLVLTGRNAKQHNQTTQNLCTQSTRSEQSVAEQSTRRTLRSRESQEKQQLKDQYPNKSKDLP
jgi:hypothetical protein